MKKIKRVRTIILLYTFLAIVVIAFLVLKFSLFQTHFEPNQNYQATVVTVLVAIFVLYFVLVQLTFSVSEIPTRILLKYTLSTRLSKAFIVSFIIAIAFCAILAFLKLSLCWYFVLWGILILLLITMIKYLYWFLKRMSIDEILRLIRIETKRGLAKLNELEENIATYDRDFENFLAVNPNWKYDRVFTHQVRPILRGMYPFYTLEIRERAGLLIKEINIREIQRELKEICLDTHVKVIFDVRPSSPLSEEGSPLFTLIFEKVSSESHGDYTKVKEEFVQRMASGFRTTDVEVANREIDEETTRILRESAERCLPFFKMEKYEEWLSPVDLALQDLKEMTTYAIKREEELDLLCETFREIVFDQLFAINPEVYLELKKGVFLTIMETVERINRYALNKENVEFLDKMIEMFYKLTYFKIAPSKNRNLFEQVFSQLDKLHSQLIVSPYKLFYPKMTVLVLIISEWVGFLRKDFEGEEQDHLLDSFYKPVLEVAVDTSFRIVKKGIDWFRKDQNEYFRKYLHEQMQQFINMLQFQKDHPSDYFKDASNYYTVEFALKNGRSVDSRDQLLFDLAKRKAETVKQLKKQLQRKVVQLSIYVTYKFAKNEIPSEYIWKIALPSANCSYYHYGLGGVADLTELYNDYTFHSDTWEMFDFQEIRPAGPILLGQTKTINTFWVLLNIQRLQCSKQLDPLKTSEELKKELLEAIDSMRGQVWADALNMQLDEFDKLKLKYQEYINTQMQVTNSI